MQLAITSLLAIVIILFVEMVSVEGLPSNLLLLNRLHPDCIIFYLLNKVNSKHDFHKSTVSLSTCLFSGIQSRNVRNKCENAKV